MTRNFDESRAVYGDSIAKWALASDVTVWWRKRMQERTRSKLKLGLSDSLRDAEVIRYTTQIICEPMYWRLKLVTQSEIETRVSSLSTKLNQLDLGHIVLKL